MHCIILANNQSSFPSSLRPVQGRACIDYQIIDANKQKEITSISLVINKKHRLLFDKHFMNTFPNNEKPLMIMEGTQDISNELCDIKDLIQKNDLQEDLLILIGNAHSSLQLQDFIRYYRQFNSICFPTYNIANNPHIVPYIIIPVSGFDAILHFSKDSKDCTLDSFIKSLSHLENIKIYNMGTGHFSVK